jgi:hypothetical protein
VVLVHVHVDVLVTVDVVVVTVVVVSVSVVLVAVDVDGHPTGAWCKQHQAFQSGVHALSQFSALAVQLYN